MHLTCTGCGRIESISTSLKNDEPGGLSWGGQRMQRADGFHLRRRTRLSIHTSKRWWTDCSRSDGSFTLHQTPCSCARRCVNGWPRRVTIRPELSRKESLRCYVPGLLKRKDAAEIRKRPERPGKATDWSDQMDVLECSSRWFGADTRPNRRARRRF